MRWIKFLFSTALTVGLTYLLLTPIAPLPTAAGKLLDPFSGFWQNAKSANEPLSISLDLEGLQEEVEVVYDERGVPHIFAKNAADLYFAQGYVSAYDRLWQMDFQVRASAGRLAEVLGAGPDSAILNFDRKQRRFGMGYAAENTAELLLKNDTTRLITEAYVAGVNAYVASLTPDTYPIEFKFLNYAPEEWSVGKVANLARYLSQDIGSRGDDLRHTLALTHWGKKAVELMYPDYPYLQDPVIPTEPRQRPLRIRDLPVPPATTPEAYDPLKIWKDGEPQLEPDVMPGSNNWVIAGSKMESGVPTLANDPHLGLNLPSIWYEMQLNAPGMNVYGATLPGAPSVIIGFNDSISWGITAASEDVLDYYAITFKDESRKQYWYKDNWQTTVERVDTIRIKGGGTFVDKTIFTHHGPVMYDETFGEYDQPIAAQWIAHRPSNELMSFYWLNRGRNYKDYMKAVAYQSTPAINLVFAATDGDIALWHVGRYPNRWEGQGKYLLDGSKAEHDWHGLIPLEQLPHAYNPSQGYVGSANQHPTTPDYPYYYLGGFDEYRGRRLYEMLGAQDTFSFEDMKRIQLDTKGLFATDILQSLLLTAIDTPPAGLPGRVIFDSLAKWDGTYSWGMAGPYLHDRWWNKLYFMIWDEFEEVGGELEYPDRSTTIGLLRDSVNYTFYRRVGDTTEYTREDLIKMAFSEMSMEVLEEYPDPEDWLWEKRHSTSIRHLTRVLGGFSRMDMPTRGRGTTLNATGRFTGPSWRMIVQMSEPIKAQGIYPGGQSGRPGSAHYDDFIDDWREGTYYDLWLMQSASDKNGTVSSRTTFTPASRP